MDKDQNKDITLGYITKWFSVFGVDHVFCDQKKLLTESQNITQSSEPELNLNSIDEIKEAVLNIECFLKKTAKNTVFSDGDPKSEIMILGEAPGQEEDEQGKPFVGQSGKLLDNMLSAVGLSRSCVYISNIVFWRPPGNRNPSADEIALCMPYVRRHIQLVQPKVLLLLGGVAVRAVLNTNEPISRLRGRQMKFEDIVTIASFHPAYLLRSPAQKAVAFHDFATLKIMLDQIKG